MSGLDLPGAALAYAEAGWFVLPVAPGSKNPGSVVGGRWQDKSSHDPEQIAEWWGGNPDYGIALHVGRSGAIAFDLDGAALRELPSPLADGLRQGVCQLSRVRNPDRGHYMFASDGAYGNGAGAFRSFGDVRGKNGVIIAAPTQHVREDGQYRWTTTGELPELPEALRACLSAVTVEEADPLTEEQMAQFLTEDENDRADRPHLLEGVLTDFERQVRDGGSSHEALVQALPWAFREVLAGFYPAAEALTRLDQAFNESFGWEGRSPDGRRSPAPGEFLRTAQWAAAQAKLADPAETLARVDRDTDSTAITGDLDADTARELAKLRVRDRARELYAAEKAQSARFPVARSGLDAIRRPSIEPPHLVDGLVIGEGITLLSAQNKTGKSTVGINLAKAAIYSEPLFGTLPTNLNQAAHVGIMNAEVSPATYEKWCREHGMFVDEEHAARIHFQHVSGYPVDLESPAYRRWAIDWLSENGVKLWILDPLSKIYRGDENSASEVNAWWMAVREIMSEADVPAAFVIHHAGHVAEGARARARGSSALEGDPEVILSYEHSGKPGEIPPDDRRYLSGVGRIDMVGRLNLGFDRVTRRLTVDGRSGGKQADQYERLDREVTRTAYRMLDALATEGKPEVLSQVALKRNVSGNDRAIEAAIERCRSRKWLCVEKATTGRKEWQITRGEEPLTVSGKITLKGVNGAD